MRIDRKYLKTIAAKTTIQLSRAWLRVPDGSHLRVRFCSGCLSPRSFIRRTRCISSAPKNKLTAWPGGHFRCARWPAGHGASNGLFGSKQKPQPCQPGLRVRWRCKGANQNSARHFKEIAGLLLFYIGAHGKIPYEPLQVEKEGDHGHSARRSPPRWLTADARVLAIPLTTVRFADSRATAHRRRRRPVAPRPIHHRALRCRACAR